MESESVKPIPVSSPDSHPVLYKIRCLVDLQLATIHKYLVPAMQKLQGSVLDVGAGKSPWKTFLPAGCSYQGIDVDNASDYGMGRDRPEIIYYDGRIMPFADSSFDNVICIEVLEHTEDPVLLLREIHRV